MDHARSSDALQLGALWTVDQQRSRAQCRERTTKDGTRSRCGQSHLGVHRRRERQHFPRSHHQTFMAVISFTTDHRQKETVQGWQDKDYPAHCFTLSRFSSQVHNRISVVVGVQENIPKHKHPIQNFLLRATDILPSTQYQQATLASKGIHLRELALVVSRRGVAADDVLGRLAKDRAGLAVSDSARDLLAALPHNLQRRYQHRGIMERGRDA